MRSDTHDTDSIHVSGAAEVSNEPQLNIVHYHTKQGLCVLAQITSLLYLQLYF